MVSTIQSDLTGRRLGEFEIRERISTGGMGTVYKAYQRGMERLVALKVLPPELAENPVALQRFYQEARAAARLEHPHIVRAIAVGEQEGLHYFAMEYVEGENLARRIKRAGPLSEAEAIRVITAVAEALAAAHARGILHRDVKPENVLLSPGGLVRLADFGLVKRLDQDLGLTDAGKGLGTTSYMAPEQFKDAKNADPRCDIYGLGATLYAALTAAVPWAGLDPLTMYRQKLANNLRSVREVRPEISAETEAVVRRAMSVSPLQRFANCGEFLEALGTRTTQPLPSPVEEQPTRAQIELPAERPASIPAEDRKDTWFVRFFEKGQRRQLRLRAGEIRQGIKSGRLADGLRLSRSEHGPWLHLSAYGEFVDLVAQLSRGEEQTEMESDIQRTVAKLHAGAPLRRHDRNWPLLALMVTLAVALAGWGLWFFGHLF